MGWDLAIRELDVCFGLVTSPLTGIIKTSLRLVRAGSLVSRGFSLHPWLAPEIRVSPLLWRALTTWISLCPWLAPVAWFSLS